MAGVSVNGDLTGASGPVLLDAAIPGEAECDRCGTQATIEGYYFPDAGRGFKKLCVTCKAKAAKYIEGLRK